MGEEWHQVQPIKNIILKERPKVIRMGKVISLCKLVLRRNKMVIVTVVVVMGKYRHKVGMEVINELFEPIVTVIAIQNKYK